MRRLCERKWHSEEIEERGEEEGVEGSRKEREEKSNEASLSSTLYRSHLLVFHGP